ncbi:MAG: NAD-dependent epimerase/dehydratase family protein [Candidatus Micrarchaeia archaeon]|jgi:nucleoside-diphosphate-sugar epimerase
MHEKGTICITGGSGRLARTLSPALLNLGYTVKALVKQKEDMQRLPAGVIPFVGSIDNLNVLRECVEGADLVIHAAAIVKEAGTTTKEIMHVNFEGTELLLNACKLEGCKRIMFTSTIDVYGRERKEVLNEESIPKPTDRYGYSKLMAEQAIIESGIDYTIFRIATIYGPGFEHYFFKMFKAIVEGKVAIIGDGQNHLAMIHARDVAEAFLLAIQNKSSIRKIYVLGDGVPYTQEGLIRKAAELLRVPPPEKHVNKSLALLLAKKRGLESDELRFLISNRVLDISKIKRELGFEPKVSIDEGGKELVDMFISSERLVR